jgi:hypothetical protein
LVGVIPVRGVTSDVAPENPCNAFAGDWLDMSTDNLLEETQTNTPISLDHHLDSEAGWIERQREYEALLEEKSEVIRTLHRQLQELRQNPPAAAPAPPPQAPAPAAEDSQLASLKEQLDEDRRQLSADEDALMVQMREMEMAMSRERAEVARQRTEVQRLHNDLKHELGQAARNAGLRERLLPLQRRHQELATRKGG